MTNKKFQIFISSTYLDLKEERAAILQRILDYGHIPSGMELFPTTDSDPLKYIKKVIDQADYYILVIGGKYGSTDKSGISYTQREFEYALQKNIPILAFLHEDSKYIPAAKLETNPTCREKLKTFREKIQQHCSINHWDTKQELEGQVFVALSKAITTDDRPVWRKLPPFHDAELKKQIHQLTMEKTSLLKENDKYIKELQKHTQLKIFHLAEDTITLQGTLEKPNNQKINNWKMQTTWKKLFLLWGPRIICWKDAPSAIRELNTAIIGSETAGMSFRLHEYIFHAIKFKLLNCGMLEVNKFTDHLKLSPEGEQYLRTHIE